MAENIGINHKDRIEEAMERWLYKYKKTSVKTATFNRLICSFNLLREYSIASRRIMDLCTDDIQRFINRLADDGYSISTIRKEYHLLTGFIRFAMGEGVAIRPAHINVTLPRAEHIARQTKQAIAYDPAEQARLMAAIKRIDSTGARAALLMLETGMRSGEVLALRWSDVIWQRRAIRVHSTLVNPQSQTKSFVQDSPKSRSSARTIPLSANALELLTKMRRDNTDLIFTAKNRPLPFGYNSLRNELKQLCEEAKVPYRGAHAFRHTFATNAFYKGCEIKILSKLLGHASVTITYNTYIHLYGDALEEMRSIVE